MIVMKQFTFDSSHQLRDYDGPCANLHGHTYKLEVYVSGPLTKQGFVIDFTIIKKVVQENVIKVLDHRHLNNIIEQPTAEHIVQWIWAHIQEPMASQAKGAKLAKIVLWETPTSCAIFDGESS